MTAEASGLVPPRAQVMVLKSLLTVMAWTAGAVAAEAGEAGAGLAADVRETAGHERLAVGLQRQRDHRRRRLRD